jgi:prepilin-type N-terminal cleavage/methylation domain-containing protein
MLRTRGFTLLEIAIAVSIMLLIFALSVPSMSGVLADKRLRRSLDGFNDLVHQAQEHSVSERRAYLLVWGEKNVVLRPEAFRKDEEPKPAAQFPLERGDILTLNLPSALAKDLPAEWIFWPSGTCEPAIVRFKSRNGSWAANYSPLTAHPDLISYAAR